MSSTPYATAPSSDNEMDDSSVSPDIPTTSSPSTPGGHLTFTPRRAMASFENLVAMANHQERLRQARKVVWRDRGEPVAELNDLYDTLVHAGLGALRSGTLAFSIRACFNIVLALIRVRSVPTKRRLVLFLRAVFGPDTWRFAAMLASFVSIYKFLLNSLPILIPAINPSRPDVFAEDDLESNVVVVPLPQPNYRRSARLSLSAHAQMALVRKRTRRWHAALAGAMAGGLAIMWEKKGRRTVIAQQLFVRGLQCSYNYYATKHSIKIPHGDVLVFTLACGQILYSWLMRPDTLPRSYSAWITQASKVPQSGVDLNYHLVREHSLHTPSLDKLLARKDITASNAASLQTLKETFSNHAPDAYIPLYAPCEALHPWLTSCRSVPLDRFISVFRWMLPIYGALHLIPAVLFRRKMFMKDPVSMLIKAALGAGRSSAFLGVFVAIYQSMNCFNHQLHAYLSKLPASSRLKIRQDLLDTLLISKGTFMIPGLMSGLALFVEEKRRRAELAMYVLPKAMESAWIIGRGKVGILKRWRGGEGMLTAAGMAMVMSTYQNNPEHLSGLVRRILYQFIGPN